MNMNIPCKIIKWSKQIFELRLYVYIDKILKSCMNHVLVPYSCKIKMSNHFYLEDNSRSNEEMNI